MESTDLLRFGIAGRALAGAVAVAALLAATSCGGGDAPVGDSRLHPLSAGSTMSATGPAKFDADESPDLTCVVGARAWPAVETDVFATQAYAEITDFEKKVGMYHTGMDFQRPRDAADARQPLNAAAIARGRVVGVFDSGYYEVVASELKPIVSDKLPRPRMQGVVLLKHTTAAGTVSWSLYGHLDPAALGAAEAAFGNCIEAGTALGVSLSSQNHHVHVERKTKPTESNPKQDVATCDTSKRCWGYTSLKPGEAGYLDPVELILDAAGVEPSGTFTVSEGGYKFRPIPLLSSGGAQYGATVGGEVLQVTERVASPNSSLCKADWLRVSRVALPDCKGNPADCFKEINCRLQDDQSRHICTIESAWVCGVAGNVQTPKPARLNDTGVRRGQCYKAGSNALVSCDGNVAKALNSQQDGMVGRDVTDAGDADGRLGFSFSLVPKPGGGTYGKTQCVKDNVTGLTWEGKTNNGGLRDGVLTYTNWGDSRPGDASAYAAYVNGTALCGFTNWRLPDRWELQGIVDYSVAYPGPTIDAAWFPNSFSYAYRTSSPVVGYVDYAWSVYFDHGWVTGHNRYDTGHVRLVR